jgi:hypothetical protein
MATPVKRQVHFEVSAVGVEEGAEARIHQARTCFGGRSMPEPVAGSLISLTVDGQHCAGGMLQWLVLQGTKTD